mmetsp:Transcript_84176/g.162439  ORF Transcript_84176/g.162439 Transcript_84176/m.162439 type:complete len:215 (-) Transcript_84176:728-1372(-)
MPLLLLLGVLLPTARLLKPVSWAAQNRLSKVQRPILQHLFWQVYANNFGAQQASETWRWRRAGCCSQGPNVWLLLWLKVGDRRIDIITALLLVPATEAGAESSSVHPGLSLHLPKKLVLALCSSKARPRCAQNNPSERHVLHASNEHQVASRQECKAACRPCLLNLKRCELLLTCDVHTNSIKHRVFSGLKLIRVEQFQQACMVINLRQVMKVQ